MTITAAQLKAAREILGWSQDDVAAASGLELPTITNFEHGKQLSPRAALADIRLTSEAAGLEFIDVRPGVRLKGRDGN
jgi:transcriptional regulator with XRE-family HTH domain